MGQAQESREGNVDLISLQGILDEDAILDLRRAISTLRRRGSQKILLLGGGIERVEIKGLELARGAIRLFRHLNGIVALADCRERDRRVLERSSWYKYLNVFKTRQEALAFLDPSKSG